jgi:hypothetical protein
MDVRSRKAEEFVSSVDHQVLSAVVFDQAFSVIPTVILESKPRRPVVEVSPANESTLAVAEVRLDFGTRKARPNQ